MLNKKNTNRFTVQNIMNIYNIPYNLLSTHKTELFVSKII